MRLFIFSWWCFATVQVVLLPQTICERRSIVSDCNIGNFWSHSARHRLWCASSKHIWIARAIHPTCNTMNITSVDTSTGLEHATSFESSWFMDSWHEWCFILVWLNLRPLLILLHKPSVLTCPVWTWFLWYRNWNAQTPLIIDHCLCSAGLSEPLYWQLFFRLAFDSSEIPL